MGICLTLAYISPSSFSAVRKIPVLITKGLHFSIPNAIAIRLIVSSTLKISAPASNKILPASIDKSKTFLSSFSILIPSFLSQCPIKLETRG
jgi:hypothetical protein